MQIFIETIYLNEWEDIEISPFIPTIQEGDKIIVKLREEWDEEVKKKSPIQSKGKKYIITFVLGIDEYFIICNCKTIKEM